MQMRRVMMVCAVLVLAASVAACAKKKPPVARPTPPPPASTPTTGRPPAPPEPVAEPQPVPAEPVAAEDTLAARDIDAINRDSPFQPVFYLFDMAELDGAGQQVLNTNADILRKYPTWIVTIEGHADERGTAGTTWRLGSAARWPHATTWSRSVFRPIAAHGQLRQGVPLRSGSRRSRLVEESARALRGN